MEGWAIKTWAVFGSQEGMLALNEWPWREGTVISGWKDKGRELDGRAREGF